MKAKTALKWTIGVIAVVILIALGAVVSLFVAFFVSMERGEKHQRQIRAEQDSGRWDFGDQPALFAVAQGIVKNGTSGQPRLCGCVALARARRRSQSRRGLTE